MGGLISSQSSTLTLGPPVAMHARYLALVIAVTTVLASVQGIAKGGYVRPPPVHDVAAAPSDLPSSSPGLSADEILSECGSHRHRDPATQICRGPGDF